MCGHIPRWNVAYFKTFINTCHGIISSSLESIGNPLHILYRYIQNRCRSFNTWLELTIAVHTRNCTCHGPSAKEIHIYTKSFKLIIYIPGDFQILGPFGCPLKYHLQIRLPHLIWTVIYLWRFFNSWSFGCSYLHEYLQEQPRHPKHSTSLELFDCQIVGHRPRQSGVAANRQPRIANHSLYKFNIDSTSFLMVPKSWCE